MGMQFDAILKIEQTRGGGALVESHRVNRQARISLRVRRKSAIFGSTHRSICPISPRQPNPRHLLSFGGNQ